MRKGWLGSLLPKGPRKKASAGQAPRAHAPRRKRDASVLDELVGHYEDLMDSGAFLYAFLDFEGAFLLMNKGMRRFWGRRLAPESLLSCCASSEMEAMRALLRDARDEPVSALVPLTLGGGDPLWMDAEFSPAEMMGNPVIQLIGVDVTGWAKFRDESDREQQDRWSRVLDSCPGLLCCVLDGQGKLLYASQGYRAIALRVLDHSCVPGRHYPSVRTDLDRKIHDILKAACLGNTGTVEVPERNGDIDRLWDFTAAPLKRDGETYGAVLRVLPVFLQRETPPRPVEGPGESAQPETRPEEPEPPSPTPLPFDNRVPLDAIAARTAVVDAQGVCLAASESFALAFDAAGRAAGRRVAEMIPADDPANAGFPERFSSLLLAREGKVECRLPTSGGELLWLEVRARPVDWAGGEAVMLTCEDITLLRRTQDLLQRVRETDCTTGILNRQGMERLLDREVQRAVRERSELSLMSLDIDGFRRMNESRGYSEAERALKALTAGLKSALSPGDVIGRWGGDEFLILTPRSGAAARLLANRLRDMARGGAFGVPLTFSAGVAECGAGMDVSALVGAAYDAMVSAKRSGGDRTVVGGKGVPPEKYTTQGRIGEVGTDSDYR